MIKKMDIDVEKFCNYEYLNRHLELRLTPLPEALQAKAKYHQSMMMFDPDLDFAVCFAIRLDDESSIIVSDDLLLKSLNMDVHQLFHFYLQTEPDNIVITSLGQMLDDWAHDRKDHPLATDDFMLVTNRACCHGSGLFFHPIVQHQLWELFPFGFYVAFSSKDECIIANRHAIDAETFWIVFTDAYFDDNLTPPDKRVTSFIYQMVEPNTLERMVMDNDANQRILPDYARS